MLPALGDDTASPERVNTRVLSEGAIDLLTQNVERHARAIHMESATNIASWSMGLCDKMDLREGLECRWPGVANASVALT